MSILIPDMEMPTRCWDCPFDNKLYCVAYVPSKDMIYDISDGRPDWCPLIELLPHGRLGDLDALIIDLMDRGVDGVQTDDLHEILQTIMDANTIIPAEGGADG